MVCPRNGPLGSLGVEKSQRIMGLTAYGQGPAFGGSSDGLRLRHFAQAPTLGTNLERKGFRLLRPDSTTSLRVAQLAAVRVWTNGGLIRPSAVLGSTAPLSVGGGILRRFQSGRGVRA